MKAAEHRPHSKTQATNLVHHHGDVLECGNILPLLQESYARLLRSDLLMKMCHAAAYWDHPGRLRRDRAGDCRSRTEV
jgi:hypothetical protein